VHRSMSEEYPPDEFVHKNMSKETCKWRGKRNIKETTCCHQVPKMRVRAHTCQKRHTYEKRSKVQTYTYEKQPIKETNLLQKRPIHCRVFEVRVCELMYEKTRIKVTYKYEKKPMKGAQKRSIYCPLLGVQVRAFIYEKITYKRDLCI